MSRGIEPAASSGGENPAFSDPFLLMAEDWVPRDAFSQHPHRGIETVTLVLDGACPAQKRSPGMLSGLRKGEGARGDYAPADSYRTAV